VRSDRFRFYLRNRACEWNILALLLKDTSSLTITILIEPMSLLNPLLVKGHQSSHQPQDHPPTLKSASLTLESSVLEELLKVSLEPSTSLGSRHQRISVTAVSVVAGRTRVAGAVTLATRLDPNNGIDKSIARVGGRDASETGTLDVAPVAPSQLSRRLDAAARLVDDEVCVPAVGLEQRGDGVDVQLLVEVLVALGVGRGGGDVEAVVVGDVGGQTAEGGGLAGFGVDLGEQLGGGCQVGFPAEPAGVACIGVGCDVGEVERLDCVLDTRNVGRLGFLALGDAEVGDEVAETVRLWG
jgi:hypothetical protein